MGCAGLDPDSGLMVLVGGGAYEHFRPRSGRPTRGYVSGDGSDSVDASDWELACSDEELAAKEFIPFVWQRGLQPSAAATPFPLPKRRRQSPPRRFASQAVRFRNTARNNLLVLPSESPAFSVPLDAHDPLVTAVEIHALASLQGYPFPSVGIAVALATGSRKKFVGPLMLVACELSPAGARCRRLTAAGTDCQAVCLDRAKQVAVAAETRRGGRFISFHRLRVFGSSFASVESTATVEEGSSRGRSLLVVSREWRNGSH